MRRDIRDTSLYRETEALYRALRQPGTGQVSGAAEIHVAPEGQYAVFSGTIVDSLEGIPPTRVCLTDLATGDTRVLTFGPNSDRSPKYSPDGRHVAFLSDRETAGDFQLYLINLDGGAARAMPVVEGWIEYLHWSPDGKRILLGVAGRGADFSGAQGALSSKQASEKVPSWAPIISVADESFRWRRAWVYEFSTHSVRQVSSENTNVWEAVWCGNDSIAAVVSPGPGEGLWYSGHLQVINIRDGRGREVYAPTRQLGWPAASPSGKRLAVVEALCSDRWLVAGDLRLIDSGSGEVQQVDAHGVDITHTEWRSERHLLVAGHRGLETVVGLYDAGLGTFTELWCSQEISTGATSKFYVTVSGFKEAGDCVLVGEGFARAPEIAVIRGGKYRSVRSFDVGYGEQAKAIAAVEQISWAAPDGLTIQGWLLRPEGVGPYPVIMNVHGGPVWHWRPLWLPALFLMFVKRGYALFLPNPRGSSGRGQDFVRHVYGDLGGADTHDLLSGLDALVERGLADPNRLGVTGGSYGGFMTSWLVTQDTRFAAAVPASPHTNQVTERLLSNIPHFMDLFLADRYNHPGGKYSERSPIMHAHKVKTPTLNICGALDRCTPPEEAIQFHHALLENAVKSVLIVYPEEGHGVRKLPAALDYSARVMAWFEEHMPAGR